MLWNLVESNEEALDPQQQMRLHKLLLEFMDVFAFSDSHLGQTHILCHTIPTESVPLIMQQKKDLIAGSQQLAEKYVGS